MNSWSNYLPWTFVLWFPLLKSLHWLPVQTRIIYKLYTIAYQTPPGKPAYLFSMLSIPPKPRELRSSAFHLLSIPRVKTRTGTRAFSVFGMHSMSMLSHQIALLISVTIWKLTFSDSLMLPKFIFHLIIVDQLESYLDYEFAQPLF